MQGFCSCRAQHNSSSANSIVSEDITLKNSRFLPQQNYNLPKEKANRQLNQDNFVFLLRLLRKALEVTRTFKLSGLRCEPLKETWKGGTFQKWEMESEWLENKHLERWWSLALQREHVKIWDPDCHSDHLIHKYYVPRTYTTGDNLNMW